MQQRNCVNVRDRGFTAMPESPLPDSESVGEIVWKQRFVEAMLRKREQCRPLTS